MYSYHLHRLKQSSIQQNDFSEPHRYKYSLVSFSIKSTSLNEVPAFDIICQYWQEYADWIYIFCNDHGNEIIRSSFPSSSPFLSSQAQNGFRSIFQDALWHLYRIFSIQLQQCLHIFHSSQIANFCLYLPKCRSSPLCIIIFFLFNNSEIPDIVSSPLLTRHSANCLQIPLAFLLVHFVLILIYFNIFLTWALYCSNPDQSGKSGF